MECEEILLNDLPEDEENVHLFGLDKAQRVVHIEWERQHMVH